MEKETHTVSLYSRAVRYLGDVSGRAKRSRTPLLNVVASDGLVLKDREKKLIACNSRSSRLMRVACSAGRRLENRSQAQNVMSRLSCIGFERIPGLASTGTFESSAFYSSRSVYDTAGNILTWPLGFTLHK